MEIRVWGLIVGLGWACGGDALSPQPSAAGSDWGSGAAGSSSFVVAISSSGSAPTVAATGAAVSCGTASCTAPMANPAVSTVTPMACCIDATANRCGYVVHGICTPPAPAAPRCPTTGVSAAAPCCVTSSNVCGVDATPYGMGCVAVPIGATVTCDGGPASGSAG